MLENNGKRKRKNEDEKLVNLESHRVVATVPKLTPAVLRTDEWRATIDKTFGTKSGGLFEK
jgi:hypothetical protein